MNQPHQKPHISPTQLEMAGKCWAQYEQRYILGNRVPPGIAPAIGTGVHRGAETNFRQKVDSHEDMPTAEIVEAAVSGFELEVASGIELTAEESSRGKGIVLGEAKDQTASLAAVHAATQAPDYQPVAVEHRTTIVLPRATHDLLTITDLRDNRDRVADFKTAGKKKSQGEADSSVQLTVEAAAFHIDTGRQAAEVRLDVLVKTKQPYRQVLATHRTIADFHALTNRINAMLAMIEKGIFPPTTPGAWWCSPRWCGYWATCPYVNSQRRDAAERNASE